MVDATTKVDGGARDAGPWADRLGVALDRFSGALAVALDDLDAAVSRLERTLG